MTDSRVNRPLSFFTRPISECDFAVS